MLQAGFRSSGRGATESAKRRGRGGTVTLVESFGIASHFRTTRSARVGERWRPFSTSGSATLTNITNPLIRKLRAFTALTAEDEVVLAEATARLATVGGKQDLVSEGDSPADVKVILDGFACRYRIIPDGRRQILSFLVPGDMSEGYATPPRSIDFSVATITPCRVVDLDRKRLRNFSASPAIADALRISSFSEEAISREWIVNVGRRNAAERLAHLLAEFLTKLRIVGLAEGNRFDFPVTQADLADSTSLSMVYVNRILQDFRQAGILTLNGGKMVIHDVRRLKRLGGFSSNYLQFGDDLSEEPDGRRNARREDRPQA